MLIEFCVISPFSEDLGNLFAAAEEVGLSLSWNILGTGHVDGLMQKM